MWKYLSLRILQRPLIDSYSLSLLENVLKEFYHVDLRLPNKLPCALFLYNQEQWPGLNKEAAKTATTAEVVTYRQFSFL